MLKTDNNYNGNYLFLDDLRQPNEVFYYTQQSIFLLKKWQLVKNYNEFVTWITKNGLPDFISFNHDLAYIDNAVTNRLEVHEKTGFDCAKWLVDFCLDHNLSCPKFYCHSMNPVGKEKINSLLFQFSKSQSERMRKNNICCHSGAAEGADTYFEITCKKYNITTIAYSYKTPYHKSQNKYELSEEDFKEAVQHVYKANETLKKYRLKPYLKLYARSWFQVKNAEQIFAISTFIQIENQTFVKGGTGVTVQMAIGNNKEVFVFDQNEKSWFYWDYNQKLFKTMNIIPKITATNFAGIGTRNINKKGIEAIENLLRISFE